MRALGASASAALIVWAAACGNGATPTDARVHPSSATELVAQPTIVAEGQPGVLLPRPDGRAVLSVARRAWLWSAAGVEEVGAGERDVEVPRGDCLRGTGLTLSPWTPEPTPCISLGPDGIWNRDRPLEHSRVRYFEPNALAPSGAYYAARRGSELRVWSLEGGRLVRTVEHPRDFEFSPSGRYLVVIDRARVPTLIDLRGERENVRVESAIGFELEGFSTDETVVAFSRRDGERIHVQHADAASGAALASIVVSAQSQRWYCGTSAYVVSERAYTVYSVRDGSTIASATLPTHPVHSDDGTTLAVCASDRIEIRDGSTLAVRTTIRARCAPEDLQLSGDGRLLTNRKDQRVVRLSDGASITLRSVLDERGAHHFASTDSGAFWALRDDRPDATHFVAPTLLRDFFGGRPLPERSTGERSALPLRMPHVVVDRTEDVEPNDALLRWVPDIAGAHGRLCRDARCRSVIADRVQNGSRLSDVRSLPAVVYFSVVHAGRSSAPVQYSLRVHQNAELATEPPLELTHPLTAPIAVRFRADAPAWTAQLFACDGPREPAPQDPGCGVLRLASGTSARFLIVDLDLVPHDPVLSRVRSGDREALVLVEARGLEEHADAWTAHVIEDGPRLALRANIHTCWWGDHGSSCGTLRARARYLDADRDGQLDLGFDYVTPRGRRSAVTFVRRGERFAPSSELDEALGAQFGLAE